MYWNGNVVPKLWHLQLFLSGLQFANL